VNTMPWILETIVFCAALCLGTCAEPSGATFDHGGLGGYLSQPRLRVAGIPVYSARSSFTDDILKEWQADFLEQTGYEVDFLDLSSGDVSTDQHTTSVRARIENIDIAAVDSIHLAALEDHLAPIQIPEDLLAPSFETFVQQSSWKDGSDTPDGYLRLIGVPWYMDVGLLYYRSDLLSKYNISEPGPGGWTFAEMEEIALQVQTAERVTNPEFQGFLWPGLDYEGLTCVTLEVIAGHGETSMIKPNGGLLLDDDSLLQALNRMSKWIWGAVDGEGGISPTEVLSFRESDIRRRFCEVGDAMFARHWPSFIHDCESEGMAGKFGVTRLPGNEAWAGRGASGGTTLVISKHSEHQAAAQKFVEFALSRKWQLDHWKASTRIPSRMDLNPPSEAMCTDSHQHLCRLPLSDVSNVSVQLPGHERPSGISQEVIVSEESGLCPNINRYATICDVNLTDYFFDRNSVWQGQTYSEISRAFVDAVHVALEGIVINQEVARSVICKMVEASHGPNRMFSMKEDGSRAWACSSEVCPNGHYMTAGNGDCAICRTFVVSGSFCMDAVALGVISVVALAAILAAYLAFRSFHRNSSGLWQVKPDELTFASPPEVLGRGTFGLVVRAEYRGTAVAVKRVIPPDEKRFFVGFGDFASCTVQVLPKPQPSKRFRSGSTPRRLRTWHPTTTSGSLTPTPRSRVSVNGHTDSDTIQTDMEAVQSESGNSFFPPGCDTFSLTPGTPKGSVFKRVRSRFMCCRTSAERRMADLRSDFIHEMRMLSKLRHPRVLTVMGAVTAKRSELMLVMELMEHGSLHDLLHNDTLALDGELVLPILRDVAQGLRFLHSAKPTIVHGDLKAQNVLVDGKFRAKVADFGLSQKNKVGACGTPFWMAPELLRGGRNTPAADIYSFGILLSEVYCRKEPYPGEDPLEVLDAVMDPLQNKRPEVPSCCAAEVAVLMRDCWQALPSQRPTSEELDRRLQSMDSEAADSKESTNPQVFERRHTNELLYDVFPRHIAEALRKGQPIEPEAKDVVTIFFSDIVGFTDISATLPPEKVSAMLHRLYSKFDLLSEEHCVFKVETIGDAYMAVSNLVEDQHDHTKRIALFARDAIVAARETLIDKDDPDRGCVNIRVGFHSGPVVANVVGTRNRRYCLFGDSVNTASRMESSSEANRIHCSSVAANLLRSQAPDIPMLARGTIAIKGKGEMFTHWVWEGETRSIRFADEVDTNPDLATQTPSTSQCIQLTLSSDTGMVNSHSELV